MRRFWILGFGVLVGLALLLVAFFSGSQRASFDRAEAIRWESHALAVMQEAQRMRTALEDAETGERGYVITGQLGFLVPYDSGRQELIESLDRLAALTIDNVRQQVSVGELRQIVTANLAVLAETAARMRAGDQAGAVAMVAAERGKVLTDQARDELRAITEEERRRLSLRHVEAEAAVQRNQRFAILLAMVGGTAIAGMFAALVAGFLSASRLRIAASSAASEQRLRTIFETVPVGLIIGEAPSGRIVAGNQQADAIFGRPMLGSPGEKAFGDWVSFHPDGRRVDSDEYPMARALAGEVRPEMPVLHEWPDGTRRWVNLIAEPLMDGGRITGAVVAVVDIDTKTRALEALTAAGADLERRVAQEVEAREAAQSRLVQAEKLTALGQLAGGIAHDFNNVMQAITAAVSLIGRHADNPATVKRLAATVDDATRRGASVTCRLLAFARRDDLRAEPLNVARLLEGLHEVLAHTLGAAVVVQLDVATGLPPVLADRGQLEAVLVNLATNARDAMRAGGTITLSACHEVVSPAKHSSDLAAGAYVRFGVADSGIGMDEAMLARVMEPFFTTKAQGEGTGLGLSMARGFSEQSGGALAIASEVGHGTTVTLWLPATHEAVERLAEPEVPPVALGSRMPRILLVDDEAIIRDVLAEELADHGYDVIQASRGDKALALLDAGERVDLVISDLSMPGMDGVALIHAAQDRRPHLPAILLTGYAGDAATLTVGGVMSGSFSLLRKPVSGAQLSGRVMLLLDAVAAE